MGKGMFSQSSPNCTLQGHGRFLPPPPPLPRGLRYQYSVASFATLRVLSCLTRLGSAVRVATLDDFAVTLKLAAWLRLLYEPKRVPWSY
jgi:hypothetical protein